MKDVIEGSSLVKDPRRNVVLTECTTQIICFNYFVRGFDLWVGRKSIPDQYIIV